MSGINMDIIWEQTAWQLGGTGQGLLWWLPVYICSSLLNVFWTEYNINSWALQNQIPSSKQVEGFDIQQTKLPTTQKTLF